MLTIVLIVQCLLSVLIFSQVPRRPWQDTGIASNSDVCGRHTLWVLPFDASTSWHMTQLFALSHGFVHKPPLSTWQKLSLSYLQHRHPIYTRTQYYQSLLQVIHETKHQGTKQNALARLTQGELWSKASNVNVYVYNCTKSLINTVNKQ